jgi:imidazolonepropionase-like amidohydrolase
LRTKSRLGTWTVGLASALLMLSSSPGFGEGNRVEIAIRHARLIDGTGSDPVEDATLLISEGRVVEVLSGSSPFEAESEIDATGFTVVPGMVDAHSHSLVTFPDASGSTFFSLTADSFIDGPEQVEEDIERRLPLRLQRYLEAGVTTIVDPASFRTYIFDVRDKVNRGDILGPRMFITGPAFAAPGGHPGESLICGGKPWCTENLTLSTNDPDEARRGVDALADAGVDGIKVMFDDFSMAGAALPKMRHDVLTAIVEESHRRSLPVVAHVFTSEDAGVVVEAGVDALVHVPNRNLFSYETASGKSIPALLSDGGIPVVTTLGLFTEDAPALMRVAMAVSRFLIFRPSLRALKDSGVDLVMGTDFTAIGPDPQPAAVMNREAQTLIDFGFGESEVLQIATGNAARFPMIPDDIGGIAPGKRADLLLIDGDPLQDISVLFAPTVVLMDGKIVVDKR